MPCLLLSFYREKLVKDPRGRKPSTPICDTLAELLGHKYKDGFHPWLIKIGKIEKYCYARSKIDATKKVISYIAEVRQCTVNEIVKAYKNENTDEQV